MTDPTQRPTPLLVLVRDEESGWAHVGCQPPHPRQMPRFAGFVHTRTRDDLVATMRSIGYSAFATYAIDPGTINFWFAPDPPPAPPGVPQPVALPPAAA